MQNRQLTFILIIFVCLSCLYNWATPLFENSDEFFHFPLIKHLADSNFYLPVQSPNDLQDWRQQGNQPPAYHLLAALLIKPIDTSDYADVRRINPHAQIGIVGESNINAVLHPLDRSKEFQGGTAWALRLVRGFSMVLALIVVICTYYLTIYTFPGVPHWVGLLAAALVAFNPMFLFVSASVNNDNLSNAMIALVLTVLIWRYRQAEKPSAPIFILIGICLGISLLSKLSTGPFMFLVGLLWLGLTFKHGAYMVKWGFITLGIALLLSGWWYWRNYQLYGDPTGLDMFLDIVGRRPISLTSEQLWSERIGFVQSFWGLFGGMTVPMEEWAYWGFNLLSAFSILGFLGWLLTHYRSRKTSLNWLEKVDLPQVVSILWLLMSFISLIRWTALTWASQGRLWFIALPTLAAFSAMGFYWIGQKLKTPLVSLLPAFYTLLVAILAPFVWIRPAYATPDFMPLPSDPKPIAILSDPQAPAEQIYLMNADFPETLQTGEQGNIDLEFCAPTALSRNWSIFVHLVDEWEIILAQADFTPAQGTLPTSEIEAGLCWKDHYPIQVPAGIASEDTDLELRVGFYDVRDNTRMVTEDASQWASLQDVRLAVGDELQKFVLGDSLRIGEYELSQTLAHGGDELTLNLTWEVIQKLPQDYTVFVQILDLSNSYRAGAADISRPTSLWEGTIEDSYVLKLDSEAPAGVYAVIVGLYQQNKAGEFLRLRLAYDGVDTGFDYINLTKVKIE